MQKRHFNLSSAIKGNPWLMILIAYMITSILWSDIPYISFKRLIKDMAAVVMAFMVATESEPRQAIQCILRRIIYIHIPFSLLLIKYYPHLGVEFARWSGGRMWIGVAQQKNSFGQLCLIAFFYLLWALYKKYQESDSPAIKYKTYTDIFLLLLTAWLLKGPGNSYSATSIISLAAGIICYCGLLLMKKLNIRLGVMAWMMLIAFIIIYGTAAPFMGGLSFESLFSEIGRDVTLTGRTEVWKNLIVTAMQHPLLGHGFGGFWTTEAREQYNISGSHNGYLSVLLHLGFVGLILVSLFILDSCRKAFRNLTNDYYWGSLWICYLFMFMINNITETSLGSFSTILMAIILFITVSYNSYNLDTIKP
uniref:O-antigen ligase-related domain-containing protein n=1 Tax=uncultured Desulfobacterium sp. TaxID=201089 RepID=E1YJL3_9BACT|nr:hypothetical protein N47_E49790 [uncultured Desulfobacterium sp.]